MIAWLKTLVRNVTQAATEECDGCSSDGVELSETDTERQQQEHQQLSSKPRFRSKGSNVYSFGDFWCECWLSHEQNNMNQSHCRESLRQQREAQKVIWEFVVQNSELQLDFSAHVFPTSHPSTEKFELVELPRESTFLVNHFQQDLK